MIMTGLGNLMLGLHLMWIIVEQGLSVLAAGVGLGLFGSILFKSYSFDVVTLLHSERPKLYEVLAVLSAVGLICHWFHTDSWMKKKP